MRHAMRIAIVTDSHLSARAPECVRNWQAAADAVARLGVDLTVHLGDITTDGQSHPDEIAFAAELLRGWPTPLRCIPGNHDVGDGSGEAPLDRGLRGAYERAFGADRWAVRAGRWELIGLNAQLFATDTAEEAVQWRWLEALPADAADHDGAMHRVLLLHRPLLRPSAAERSRTRGRYVDDAASRRLIEGPLGGTLRLVLSGHTHQFLDWRDHASGVRHVWLPSTGFVLPDAMQPRVGEKIVGLGLLDLQEGGDAAPRVDVWCPDGMLRHDLAELAMYADLRH
ncbi:MAG TPA: metallophosphoesterase [Burkholderiaceae bacterium]|nr:metallophosphoesterase [Burkholderiaceae bacterium]